MENLIDGKAYPTQVTTPESLELNTLFSRMIESGVQTTAMEVSSHALSLDRVDGLDFDMAVFTNLTQDHLDYHKDMKHYYASKRHLFEMAKCTLFNIDDPYGQKLYNEFKGSFSYGFHADADFRASDVEAKAEGTRFTLTYKQHTYAIETPFLGRIYVLNVLAALGALSLIGYDMMLMMQAMNRVKPVRGRLEKVPNDKGIRVFVDYAHTPDALKNVLEIAREFTENRLISVFGCGGDRDRTKRPKMGKISEQIADFSIVTSDNPRSEDPMEIINEIVMGMSKDSGKYTVNPDREEAIAKAITMAKPGDTVIIAGKGHETYQIIGTTSHDFSDFEKAKKYLEEKPHESSRD
jgi:UDP-N-acetylmuramoyl-L-alanyl-D-glutamate--2,6-diaminopimelate ligase